MKYTNTNEQLKNAPEHIYEGLCAQADKVFRHARQGSYQTRKRYKSAVRVFLKFLAYEYQIQKISNVSGKHLSHYIDYRQRCGIAPATIKAELSAIRYFHDQIPDTKHNVPDNDALSVELEKRRFAEADRTWSDAEYKGMCGLAHEQGKDDFADLMVIAHDLGLRIHESHRIDTAIARDAIKNGTITIKGKGGKIRKVPLTREASSVLERKLRETAPGAKLFVSDAQPSHLAILALQDWIARNRATVRDPGNPIALTYHGLRHTFAANEYRHLKEQGRSDFEAHLQVSKLLGHERADVTDIYLTGTTNRWAG